MYNFMLTELTVQCVEHQGIKCGFIGEVGSSWPLHGEATLNPFESTDMLLALNFVSFHEVCSQTTLL